MSEFETHRLLWTLLVFMHFVALHVICCVCLKKLSFALNNLLYIPGYCARKSCGPAIDTLRDQTPSKLPRMNHDLTPKTVNLPSLRDTRFNALAPQPMATAGTAVVKGTDHSFEDFEYCWTVIPFLPALARNCPV